MASWQNIKLMHLSAQIVKTHGVESGVTDLWYLWLFVQTLCLYAECFMEITILNTKFLPQPACMSRPAQVVRRKAGSLSTAGCTPGQRTGSMTGHGSPHNLWNVAEITFSPHWEAELLAKKARCTFCWHWSHCVASEADDCTHFATVLFWNHNVIFRLDWEHLLHPSPQMQCSIFVKLRA